jgi:hypothetical protein
MTLDSVQLGALPLPAGQVLRKALEQHINAAAWPPATHGAKRSSLGKQGEAK